jgi:hypothetical protein
MLQRRLEKLEALQKEDPPALVIYSWEPPEENNGAEAGASERHNRLLTAEQGAGRLRIPGLRRTPTGAA